MNKPTPLPKIDTMTFKIKGAIFKNTAEKLQKLFGDRYDATKKYPDVDGIFGIKEEDRMVFASYVMNATANDKGEIPLRITGYNNTSQGGVKYLGVHIEPDYKTMKALEERTAASEAAQSLASATGGEVVAVDDGDLF